MTVAKKIKLPVSNEKDRMIKRATDYPQDVHDRALREAAIAIKNVYAAYDGVCGELDSYFNHLYENKKEFIPQGEQYKKFLLTCAFGDSETVTENKLDMRKFFPLEAMEKLQVLINEQNKSVSDKNKNVVRFAKLQSKDS